MLQTRYVEFGLPDAKSFFERIALPNVQAFEREGTIQSGLNAAWALWHLHDWRWHDLHPNTTQKPAPAFRQFLFQACPELEWLEVITNAAKHRGLNQPRAVEVKSVPECVGRGGVGGYGCDSGGYGRGALAYGSGAPQLRVFLDNGSARWLGEIIQSAKHYWTRIL
jgi:hypothetical protein